MILDESIVDSLYELAHAATTLGGRIAAEAFGKPVDVRRKPDGSEVTAVDERVELAMVDCIRRRRPRDGFIGEEATANTPPDSAGDGVTWVIDPIDGTRNFVRGIPCFTCAAAALRDGVPVAAAVFEPFHNEVFTAASHRPTEINGRPVRGSREVVGSRRLLGMPSLCTAGGALRAVIAACHENHVIRCFGSAQLHLALAAAGRLDGAILSDCKLWDVAAGWLLAQQAGLSVLTPDGEALLPRPEHAAPGADMPCLVGPHDLVQEWLAELRATGRQ